MFCNDSVDAIYGPKYVLIGKSAGGIPECRRRLKRLSFIVTLSQKNNNLTRNELTNICKPTILVYRNIIELLGKISLMFLRGENYTTLLNLEMEVRYKSWEHMLLSVKGVFFNNTSG
jgi:hypothetical protein